MSDYFTETDRTKKQMITAMTYPAIIFVLAIAAVVFIMVWVVPQFVRIYEGIDGAKIPDITLFVMSTSSFLQNYYLYIIIGVCVFIIIFVYLFKNVKAFKTAIQWILMHLPIFGNVIIYNEVTMFTKTFASLLSHNVFITDSMEILNKITNNEIYKMLILDTITNLAKGERISLAFKDHWAFPIPAYEMITTGERTGQLAEMMSKVSSYYQELHRNAVTRIKTFIEPALILFLTFTVGGIVLSIVIPMFSVYGKSIPYEGGYYGLGLLSKYPFVSTERILLPMVEAGREQRSLLTGKIELDNGRIITIASTHLDLKAPIRLVQVKYINEVLGKVNNPILLGGDFNARPADAEIAEGMARWRRSMPDDAFTIPAEKPNSKIDYIFSYPQETWRVIDAKVPEVTLSDHRPVVAILELEVQP